MLSSVGFKNFKALRDTVLPLAPFTLLLGPNGSGKSTALKAIEHAAMNWSVDYSLTVSAAARERPNHIPTEHTSGWVEGPPVEDPLVEVILNWDSAFGGAQTVVNWRPGNSIHRDNQGGPFQARINEKLTRFRFFSLDATAIAQSVHIQQAPKLEDNGAGLAAVLEQLREAEHERFEALELELGRWLPEYDRIHLPTVENGKKALALITRAGGHSISATQLSQGTLLALAMLTLAYLPNPPVFIGLEEPDRGIHPRLLRDLRDGLYRLSYPEASGESRAPVQVLVTTHSPYLLDLYRDHPEEIVLAHKPGLDVQFERLSDRPHFEEILGDAPLSEVWYSGILGGVPVQP